MKPHDFRTWITIMALATIATSLMTVQVHGQAAGAWATSFSDWRKGDGSNDLPQNALGPKDDQVLTMGDGGSIILGFGGVFSNVSGDDVFVVPFSEGNDSCTVEASLDGSTWAFLGTAGGGHLQEIGFDLGGLAQAQFVRVTDVRSGSGDGYNLTAVGIATVVPRTIYVAMLRGRQGHTGCGSDGLRVLQEEIATDPLLRDRVMTGIFCSYLNCGNLDDNDPLAGTNPTPVRRLNSINYGIADRVVLIGHSHGGFYAYELARRRAELLPSVPISGVITLDPIDWTTGRQCEGRRHYDQSGDRGEALTIPFSNYVQRDDGWDVRVFGFDIGNDSDEGDGDHCNDIDFRTLTNRTCIVDDVSHTGIDDSAVLHDGIRAILLSLVNS